MEYNYHKNAGQLAFIKFVKGLVHLLIRHKVEWKDKSLKKSLKGKPVVFVCNHTHHFDGVVISSVLSRYKPYMLVKKSWYDKSGTGSFIRICRSIPVQCLSSPRAELQERAKCSRSSPVRHCLRQKKVLT